VCLSCLIGCYRIAKFLVDPAEGSLRHLLIPFILAMPEFKGISAFNCTNTVLLSNFLGMNKLFIYAGKIFSLPVEYLSDSFLLAFYDDSTALPVGLAYLVQ